MFWFNKLRKEAYADLIELHKIWLIEANNNLKKQIAMIEENEIKKHLYRQKPIAEYGYEENKHAIYSTEIAVDGMEEEITFRIPMDEMYDGEGNKIFNTEEPAQLLIRWLDVQ